VNTRPTGAYAAIDGQCWPCWTGYPELRGDLLCAEEPYAEHTPEQVALALALADASRVGGEPYDDEQQRAQHAVSFLENDTQGVVSDLGPHAQWSVTFDEDREGATINGVQFTLQVIHGDGGFLVPTPPERTCAECSESVGWNVLGQPQGKPGSVEVECKGCGDLIVVAEWWPRSPDKGDEAVRDA
jgi:hypothetical protein